MNGTNYDKSTLNFLTTEKGRTQNKMDYAMTRGFYRQALSASELTQIRQVQGGLISVPGTIGFIGTRCCPLTVKSVAKCPPFSLDTVATYLRNFMPEFRNSNFWAYQCDGDEYYIDDGGNDMYDGGNFTTPWLLSGDTYVTDSDVQGNYPYAIGYLTTTQSVIDTDFSYVSLGYIQGEPPEVDYPQEDDSRHPLTVLGFRCSGPVGWQVGGELGADGEGDMISNELYSGQNINGFTVYSAYRQVYNAGDPTVCNLIILLGHSRWGSVFGPTSTYADSDTNSCGFYYYAGAGSKNILAIQTLLSIPAADDESPIPDSELQTVIFNFTKRIGESLGY